MQIVAEYFGSIGSMVFRNDTSIHWPLDRGPPKNIPDCGFKGDNPHCKVKGLVMICHQLVRKTAVFFFMLIKILHMGKNSDDQLVFCHATD